MARHCTEQAPRYGYQIVLDEEYAPGAKDFSDLILKARSANADAVLGTPSPPDGMTLVKQMKELNFTPRYLMLSRAPDAVVWGENLGKDGDYVVFSPGWHHAAKYPGVPELNARHQARLNRPADVLVGPSYAIVQILVDALQRNGRTDGESLREALARTDLTTVMGQVRFNPDGTGVVDILLPQWQNGRQELVWPREHASAAFAYPARPFDQR